MPRYAFLSDAPLRDDLGHHLTALRRVGVPYSDDMIDNATADARAGDARSPGAADLTKRGKGDQHQSLRRRSGHVTEMRSSPIYRSSAALTGVPANRLKIQ